MFWLSSFKTLRMCTTGKKDKGETSFFSSSMFNSLSKMKFIKTVLLILSLNEYVAVSRLLFAFFAAVVFNFFHELCQLIFYLFLLSQHISPELLYFCLTSSFIEVMASCGLFLFVAVWSQFLFSSWKHFLFYVCSLFFLFLSLFYFVLFCNSCAVFFSLYVFHHYLFFNDMSLSG